MRNPKLITLLCVLLLVTLACSLSNRQNGQPTAQQLERDKPVGQSLSTATVSGSPETQSSQPAEGDTQAGTIDALLAHTLSLRSVRITLVTTSPDGDETTVVAEIDADGNQHLQKTFPAYQAVFSQVGFENSQQTSEMFIVRGIPYSPDLKGVLVQGEPELRAQLEQVLKSSQGPGLWLKVLPPGSILYGGSQELGGFQALLYVIRGSLEGNVITGQMWVDSQTQALVGAELEIPSALAAAPGAASESLHVRFEVEQAHINPVKIEAQRLASPTQQAGPVVVPTNPAVQGETGEFSDFPIYEGAVIQTTTPDAVVYLVQATLNTVKEYYDMQLVSSGWVSEGFPIEGEGTYLKGWKKGDTEVMLTLTSMSKDETIVVMACMSCVSP